MSEQGRVNVGTSNIVDCVPAVEGSAVIVDGPLAYVNNHGGETAVNFTAGAFGIAGRLHESGSKVIARLDHDIVMTLNADGVKITHPGILPDSTLFVPRVGRSTDPFFVMTSWGGQGVYGMYFSGDEMAIASAERSGLLASLAPDTIRAGTRGMHLDYLVAVDYYLTPHEAESYYRDQVLPVTLTSFTAQSGIEGITLYWNTASEQHNDWFGVWRKLQKDATDSSRLVIVPSFGDSETQQQYSYVDQMVTHDQEYWYTLTQKDMSGVEEVIGHTNLVHTAGAPTMQTAKLCQNYPNPFNPTTKITYELAENGPVGLSVFNVLGVEVATLVSEPQAAGNYNITFNGEAFPAGVYIYRLETQHFSVSKKMVLLK
ncbi:MAG: T9SS type A sorting domain-containing protein [archaeon]